MSKTTTQRLAEVEKTMARTIQQCQFLADSLHREADKLLGMASRLQKRLRVPSDVNALAKVVSDEACVNEIMIFGASPRTVTFVNARTVFTQLVRNQYPNATVVKIADMVMLRDHGTVIHRLKGHARMIETNDPSYVSLWERVQARLKKGVNLETPKQTEENQ